MKLAHLVSQIQFLGKSEHDSHAPHYFYPYDICKPDVKKFRMGSPVHKPHLNFQFMERFQTLGFNGQTQESSYSRLQSLMLPRVMQMQIGQ